MTTLVARSQVTEAHRVTVRHAATGQVIPVTALPAPLPTGWWLRVRDGEVLVAVREGSPAVTAPVAITVEVADPRLALLLDVPAPTTDPLDRRIEVTLASAHVEVSVPPLPATFTVELSSPTTGDPRTGRTVTVRATSGPNPRPTVDLDEVSPGLYRSDPTVWTAAFTPLDLLVDGDLLRQTTVDVTRTETRVRLLDTT